MSRIVKIGTVSTLFCLSFMTSMSAVAEVYEVDGKAHLQCSSKVYDSVRGANVTSDFTFYYWAFVRAEQELDVLSACEREAQRLENKDGIPFVPGSVSGVVTEFRPD